MGEFTLENHHAVPVQEPNQENSAAKAKRMAEKLRFRLKESMAQQNGSAAFLHWLRAESEKRA
jgi:hypothetical protein